jgi:TetR/AcrR family transcriptional repressor of nem operon
MARPKEYVREDVVEKAMQLFWKTGYKASSVADIVRATGLNTASMYKEFDGKAGLFEAALAYYRQNKVGPRLQMLRDQPNLRGVEAVLGSVASGAIAGDYRGCLMMNHLAQRNTMSARAMQLIEDFCTELEGLMSQALRNAQAEGDIPAHKDPAALASFVVCSIHGLILYGRHPHGKQSIPKLYGLVLDALKG